MYQIKSYGNRSEVLENDKTVYIGSDKACQAYVDEYQIIMEICELPITVKMLKDVFEKIQNKEHWKNPNHIVLDTSLSSFEMALINASVEFFHGVKPSIMEDKNFTSIILEGYVC